MRQREFVVFSGWKICVKEMLVIIDNREEVFKDFIFTRFMEISAPML